MKPIKELVETYKNTAPEKVVEWNDPETNSKGWVVINSLRNGAAGGGTRMHDKVTVDEVKSLAKTMELKFTVAGPDIGGAKSGIKVDFDPTDKENKDKKKLVLEGWYEYISPLLKSCYGTGGDLNVDDDEVIEYTKPYVGDPQEGILIGQKKENIKTLIDQLQKGVSLILYDSKFTPSPEDDYKINAMITGFGVVESMRHYYKLFTSNESLAGKKAIVQGWGAVGASAGYFLAQNGAKVVAISDAEGYIVNDDGFTFEEISEMFNTSKTFNHKDKIKEERTEAIYEIKADIFAPCAGSFLVKKEHIDKLAANGVSVIASGANVPFADQQNGNIYSDVTIYADAKLSVIPDFIANCGMAHTFAYLMQNDITVNDEGIFNSVSEIIFNALKEIRDIDESNLNLTEKAIRIALKKLGYE